jgi:chromosomal replication initiator protein
MTLLKPTHWEEAMELVRTAVGQEHFDAWLQQLELEDFSDDQVLTIAVPNDFYANWISKRYLDTIESAFSDVMKATITVQIVAGESGPVSEAATDEDDFIAPAITNRLSRHTEPASLSSRRVPEPVVPPITAPRINTVSGRRENQPPPRLNPRYTFDDFVVGESNRYAQAAAQAASDPRLDSKTYNPLFIYGGVGLGKTHLMHAIGHKFYEADQTLKIVYVTSEQFINSFIDSIQNKKHGEFRASFRHVDLLLIDDVQFLTGKERTQQEFFHTFNALYDAGKKVVVTSDRPPKELSTLEDRLRSRFEWGLLVDIQPPDLETRVAILRKKAHLDGIRLPNDVALFIAERMTENIREMEGALKRLSHASALHSRSIDLEMARDILSHLMVGTPAARITVEDVQRAVCEYFKLRINDLLGTNRSKRFSQPRHLAQYLSRKLTGLSFPDIAQKFGGKDHTSIIYACRKVEQGITKDTNMANVVAYLTKQITKGSDQ